MDGNPQPPIWLKVLVTTLFFGLMLGLTLLSAANIGITYGDRRVKRAAIEAGVAYYTVDPTTGQTAFTWKTPTK